MALSGTFRECNPSPTTCGQSLAVDSLPTVGSVPPESLGRPNRISQMNRKKYASVVHGGGVLIICSVGVMAVPLLLTEMSSSVVGILLAGVGGGLVSILTARLMRRLL